ncbi:MAG: DNA polymerase I [Candidatus Eisenbacteria bacterium]
MPRLFVLDAMGLAYRAYYAFVRRPLLNSKGENTSAIFGVANLILKIRREEKPDYWALAWDGPGPTFRHERYAEYKATRKPMPEDLRSQLTPIEDMAQALGLPVLEIPGTEADDVMATLAHRGAAEGFEVVLVTSDKDMLQSVEDRVRVYTPLSRGEGWDRIDADGVRAKWGVGPEHIRDVLALMGDTSDNIPGVPGVGEKTAVELMNRFGTLEALYERLEEIPRAALRARLAEHRELAYLSRELATLRRDLDLGLTWEQLRCAPIRRELLHAFAERFEVRRLLSVAAEDGVIESEAGDLSPSRSAERRGTASETEAPGVRLAAPGVFGTSAREPSSASEAAAPPPSAASAGRVTPPAPAPAIRVMSPAPAAVQSSLDLWAGDASADADERELITRLHEVRARAIHGLALFPIGADDDARTAPLVGLALAARDGTACYLPIGHTAGPNLPLEKIREWLRPALADASVPKVAHDLKTTLHLLHGAGLPCEGMAFDLHLASFLLDPSRGHDLESLARDGLGWMLPPLDPPATRGKPRVTLASASVPALAETAAAHAAAIFPLADALRAQLDAREQWALYSQLEHPLVPVLLDMERAGVRLDSGVLGDMSVEAAKQITELEAALFALAGEALNLNSGAQVANVLFEKFKLKPGRRTKTGFSTDEAVLEELAAEHAFPKLLLEYRTLTKLRSTYLEALPAAVDGRDGRVHTTFHQTGAATGRLSSSRPNLQNIPIRTPQGRVIRRAFVAPEGGVLIGADYSQIELRVMAHLSGDPNLVEAFASGEDIHAATARKIFGVTGDTLDPELRGRAKVVNFGVMYGMGARSLSQQMGIGLEEAKEFIGHYFRLYARVREYLDGTVEEARRRGYVETLMGRRRYLPALAGGGGAERAFAERAAINTPIQGSAADLMKLAMIRVHRALRGRTGARLLLQVHDELVLECRADEADSVRELVRREMEGCYPLRVPLVVSAGTGASWFDVH